MNSNNSSGDKYEKILSRQKAFFNSGKTLEYGFRKKALLDLLHSVKKHETEILKAVQLDLGKSEFEAYTNEVGIIYLETRHIIKKLKNWMAPEKRMLEIFLQPSSGAVYSEPYGNTLIISPWNYPFQLTAAPLAAAIAAGNTAVLKPSEVAVNTARIITKLIEDTFTPEFISVFNGGPEVSAKLISMPFDKIFFTGT